MRNSLLALLFLALMLSTGCVAVSPADAQIPGQEAPPFIPDDTLVITAVGDIMMHNTQIVSGYEPQTGTYNFGKFFNEIKPLLLASDLVLGNLETTLSGKKAVYSGYPRFNAPEQLALNLKEAGFQILTTANNHCLDKNFTGLASTLKFLDQAGLLHTGTARSQEERDSILFVEKKGVKIAILAYTYGTNGITPPKDKPYAVNILEEDIVKKDIARARTRGAQLIILSLHFGQEYQQQPDPIQKNLAYQFLEAGADIILGHHPHVLQPMEIVSLKENGKEKNKFVIYSLGNFISDQSGLERQSSIILNIHFGIDRMTNEPYLKEVSYVPVLTRRYWDHGKTAFQVLAVEPALTTIRTGSAHSFVPADIEKLEKAWNHVTTHLETPDPRIKLLRLAIPQSHLHLIKSWVKT
ncbi:MAG: Capsule synthesis protein CapA [Peptococcaceae bacterium]|nr:Capsule synthesis protein CapA [Peptococcaceae bacterium]